jgi:Chaperone of endosialidase
MKATMNFPILTACVISIVFAQVSAQVTTAPNGNVGIGTNAPASKLSVINSVVGAAISTAQFKAPAIGPIGSHIHWGTTGDWYIRSAVANGTVVLQDMNPGGRVGIGTGSPLGKLHVVDSHVDVRTSDGTSPDGWAKHGFSVMSNPGAGYSAFRVTSGHNSVADRGLMSVERQGLSHFYIRMDGNVGIGTTDPRHRLTVGNASDAAPVTFRSFGENGGAWKGGGAFGGVNAAVIMGEVNGQAWLGAHNGNLSAWANLIVNRDGGNVGIGTSTPLARLDVAGSVRCTTLDLTSDRAAKDGLKSVDERAVLDRLSAIRICTWHYKESPAVRHIGPMAQDFKAAFGVGVDDKHISVVDGVGVSLAAIQGLHQLVQEKNAEIAALKHEVASVKQELATIKSGVSDRLAALEKALTRKLEQARNAPSDLEPRLQGRESAHSMRHSAQGQITLAATSPEAAYASFNPETSR